MTNDGSQATVISFGLHARRSLRMTLHKRITNPYITSERALSFGDFGQAGTGELPQIQGSRFAVMDAHRVVSSSHIAVAASSALLRMEKWEASIKMRDDDEKFVLSRRGVALETVLCASGSTHVANAMRTYAFHSTDKSSPSSSASGAATGKEISRDNNQTSFDVLVLGFDCTDNEYKEFLNELGLDSGTSKDEMERYLTRDRLQSEIQDLMKIYKITKEEMEMEGSSLERAVITRVASKFVV